MPNLSKILLFVLLFTAGFAAKTMVETEVFSQFFIRHGERIAIWVVAFLVMLAVVLIVGYLAFKAWLKRKFKINLSNDDAEMVEGMVDYFTNPEGLTDPSSADRQRGAAVSLGLWVTRHRATQFYAWLLVTLMGGMVGAATLFLLHEQNKKLDAQNIQIELQTQANIAASILLEGTRRAAQSQGMEVLFKDIRDEVAGIDQRCSGPAQHYADCRETIEPTTPSAVVEEDYRYHLSDALTKRVKSFANSSSPYHVAISDGEPLDMAKPLEQQFKFQELSPERGLLLQALIRNRVNIRDIDFSFANLKSTDLSFANLAGANLNFANFSDARLFSVNLVGAKLRAANLSNAVLTSANATAADLELSNLIGTYLFETIFKGTNLRSASLASANLNSANFSDAFLSGANFDNAWAWVHEVPLGLGPELQKNIRVCNFNPPKHSRYVEPDICETD